jgi:hypothetical protein
MTRPADEDRRQELLRLMQQPNGLEKVMQRYEALKGQFPPADLSPRQIIDAIVAAEGKHD